MSQIVTRRLNANQGGGNGGQGTGLRNPDGRHPNVFGGAGWHEPEHASQNSQSRQRSRARGEFEHRRTGPDEHAHLRVD